jgi:site-specific DNA-methyltransferase (adenine-specific)
VGELAVEVGVRPYYQDEAVTIYHGDCREVCATLPNASVDMIFTDPPYGHNNNNGDLIHRREAALGRGQAGAARPIAGDSADEANTIVRWLFSEARRVLADGSCCCCCCGGGGPDPQFARWSLWMGEALRFKQMVVWDKGGLGMGWHYRRNYETVLVAQRGDGACRWYGGRETPNLVRFPKIIPSAEEHPTEKPEELPGFFLRVHSQPSHLILDPFMGSGTTLRAAKDLGRKAIGIEIEERWCEVAAKRMAQEVLPL